MLRRRANRNLTVTVTGEFFPGQFPALRSSRWARGEEDPLATEMRLFGACERWAYNRLAEGMGKDEIKKAGQTLFGLNSRYVDDARLRAQAALDSQKERLKRDIQETERKLRRAQGRLGWGMKKLAAAREKGAVPENLGQLERAVQGRQMRVAALQRDLQALREHQRQGTLPRAVFGGRRLWRRVCRGRATREEWRAARKGHLYARGDESKGGNPNVKVSPGGEGFRLAVTISHLSEPIGVDRLGRPVMSRAPRVEGRLWLPEKHREQVRVWLALGLPYTVLLQRSPDGRFRAHLSLDLGEVPEVGGRSGYVGVDANPDGVALCCVGPDGLPVPWPEGFTVPMPGGLGKYDGEFQVAVHRGGFAYLRVPELACAPGFRRAYCWACWPRWWWKSPGRWASPWRWRAWRLARTGWIWAGSSTAWRATFRTPGWWRPSGGGRRRRASAVGWCRRPTRPPSGTGSTGSGTVYRSMRRPRW